MLNSLFKFLKGYVIIELYGRHVERFLNICTRRGIGVRDIRYSTDGSVNACVERSCFKLLRPIAYKTHTKVHIVKKKGFFMLRRSCLKHPGFIMGAAVGLVFLLTAPRFIWTVEITGVENTDKELLTAALRNAGIYKGALKSRIPEGFEVKRIVMRDDPELVWAWVYIHGTAANVHVKEKTMPPQIIDRDTPCSIAASCDAYVERVQTFYGHCAVEEGTTVRAGDVLISGKVPVFKEGYPEKYMYVHARGSITALTERSESGVYRLECERRTPTGKSVCRPYLDLFGKRINLYRNEDCGFAEYDSSEFRHELWGMALGGTQYYESEVTAEPMNIEAALQTAKEELEQRIASKLGAGARLLDEELQYEYISDKEIEVRLTMSFKEDIGTEVPIEEENTIDKQEN